MKYILMTTIIIVLLAVCIIFPIVLRGNSCEPYEDKIVKNVNFPFKNIVNENGKLMNIIALTAPFRSKEHEDMFISYQKKGIPILGVTSYLNFPGKIKNPFEDKYHINHPFDYVNSCIGWLHCFRDPSSRGLVNVPMLEMSESDFYNCKKYKSNLKKKYDFIYVCNSDNDSCNPGWQSHIRNWELFKKCLPIICEKLNLKGLIIGRINCDYTSKCKNNIEVVDFLPYWDFIKKMSECKFLIVCSVSDPSPRIIAEAMCLNLPVLVNKNIYGGWKYINEQTGEFFNDEKDIETQIRKLLSKLSQYQPRKYYQSNYGPEKSGLKLKKFVKKLHPELNDCKYLLFQGSVVH